MRDDIKWHHGFFEAVQFELCDYADVFDFTFEYQLTKEPLRIDVIIIRKLKNVDVKKNIARIFRGINIVEYKSPDDYLSVSDYKQVQGYAWTYASQKNTDIDDITVTYVVRRHPEKLFAMFAEKKRKYTVNRVENGIYYVTGGDITTQIVVEKELDASENFWLTSLRKEQLTRNDMAVLLQKLPRFGQRAKDGAFVDIIVRVNRETIEGEPMGAYFEQVMREIGLVDKIEARSERTKAQRDVLRVLEARFKSVPAGIRKSVESYTDLIALDSLLQHAAVCLSVKEFKEALVR